MIKLITEFAWLKEGNTSPRKLDRLETLIKKWSTGDYFNTKAQAQKRKTQESFPEKQHKVLWYLLMRKKVTEHLVIIRNRQQWLFDSEVQSVLLYDFHHGIKSYICDVDSFCSMVIIPPSLNQLAVDNFDVLDFSEWNVVKRLLTEKLAENACEKENALCIQALNRENRELLRALEYDRSFEQIPSEVIVEEVIRDGSPYDVEIPTVPILEVQNSFMNIGGLTEGYQNWIITGECVLKPTTHPLSEEIHGQAIIRAYLIIQWLKLHGFIPDVTQYFQCPECGQWYSYNSEHCTKCDALNPEFRPVEDRDFLTATRVGEDSGDEDSEYLEIEKDDIEEIADEIEIDV